jgi:hypothetical protein
LGEHIDAQDFRIALAGFCKLDDFQNDDFG